MKIVKDFCYNCLCRIINTLDKINYSLRTPQEALKLLKILTITMVITNLIFIYRFILEFIPSIRIAIIPTKPSLWPLSYQFPANIEKSIIFWSLIATGICLLCSNFIVFYIIPKKYRQYINQINKEEINDNWR